MAARVTLESAGSHVFDLPHLRREGAQELVELILAKAGFHQDLHWRLQVQKKIFCNGETPPVRVVDEPKKWAVYLKIKPGDNNTAHYCSLLMPPGIQGAAVYRALKQVGVSLDRNWRNKERIRPASDPPAVDLPTPALPPAAEERSPLAEVVIEDRAPASAEGVDVPPPAPGPEDIAMLPSNGQPKSPNPLKSYLDDAVGLKYLLLILHEVAEMGTQIHDNDHFVEVFLKKVGHQDLNRHQVGGIFTVLSRKGYILRYLRGSRPVGYVLSPEGWKLIQGEMQQAGPAPAAPAPVTAAPVKDPAQVLLAFHSFAEQISEVGKRVAALKEREMALLQELEQVRKEIADTCPYANDPEMLALMERLAEKQKPKPGASGTAAGSPHGTPPSPPGSVAAGK